MTLLLHTYTHTHIKIYIYIKTYLSVIKSRDCPRLCNIDKCISYIFYRILLFLLRSQQVLAFYGFALFWQQRLSVLSMARASKSEFRSYTGFYCDTLVYFSLKRGWLFQIMTIHIFRGMFLAPVTRHFSKQADIQC